MNNHKYKRLSLITANSFCLIGTWESIFAYKNQIYIDNAYEFNAYIFTIIKSLLNIFFGMYILIRYKYSSSSKDFCNNRSLECLILIFGINIWSVIMYQNLKLYSLFEPVIILEFIIFCIIWPGIILFLSGAGLILCCFYICNKDDGIPVIVIDIPQTAVPINNIMITNHNEIPNAVPVNI